MGTDVVTDPDYKLWVLLHQTRDAIRKARERDLRQVGISFIQAGVLACVKSLGNSATPANLSRWLLRERHTISELINRMVKEGLVRKVKDLDKKNLVRVALTDKGEQAYENSIKRESIHKIMSSLSEEEHRQLNLCLRKLLDKTLKELGIDIKLRSV